MCIFDRGMNPVPEQQAHCKGRFCDGRGEGVRRPDVRSPRGATDRTRHAAAGARNAAAFVVKLGLIALLPPNQISCDGVNGVKGEQ